jgi:hypothetical protein
MGVIGVRRLTVVSLCSLVACLCFSVSGALAAGPPVVEEEAVLNVAGTSATFQAKINPEGSETTYRFEYGTSAAYGSSVPVPDGIAGSGTAGVTVSAHPQDLLPSTEYHYQVVAVVASRGETVPGGDGTFITQPAGGEFALPDGRQWELVTPPNKHGAMITPLPGAAPIQAAADGGAMTYQTNIPSEDGLPGYALEEQVLSRRGVQGWGSRDIGFPHEGATGISCRPEYQFFARDLTSALAFPECSQERTILLSSEASEQTPYIRREALCEGSASASECYRPILTGKEGVADVPPGTKFAGRPLSLFIEAATPDLSHVAMAYSGEGLPMLFEWSADAPPSEAIQPINVLPESEGGGQVIGYVGAHSFGGLKGNRNAISNDGSRVVWSNEPEGSFTGPLYLRDMIKRETVRLDVQQPGVPSGGKPFPLFQIATPEDSKVFFTDFDREQRLTPQSGTAGRDLYECEIVERAARLACDLTDLTPETEGHAAFVQKSVLGASEDGSYVYFAAGGVLGDGAQHGAVEDPCENENACAANVYEYHDGKITFIAALSAEDANDWDGTSTAGNITDLLARVSANGRYLAFMSSTSLTGYDNRDAINGHPDQEVYLYDAVAKRLVCASCNPTGSRPVGVPTEEFLSSEEKESRENVVGVLNLAGLPTWIAANLPPSNLMLGQFSLYQPRALSDSGRLFFNSSDALVAQDINDQEDVYEFEPVGTGGCTASSSTFGVRSGGCVSLISSGSSPEESGFMDASENGGDVFFMTSSRLTPQDYDTSYDIYDAHECTPSVPCVPVPVALPPCASGDACKGAPSPQPSIFGAPASATFAGAGNATPPSGSRVVKGKSLTRAQKLQRALKECHRRPKRKRGMCERRARKRYGASGAHKAGVRKVRG